MMKPAKVEKVSEGLFVPCQEAVDSGEGFEPGQVVYWSHGYETLKQAESAIANMNLGGVYPLGISVDQNTGKRRKPNAPHS